MMPLFQSPMAIISEITTSKARGMALGWAFVTWAIGSCALPLIAWLIPYWKTLQARRMKKFIKTTATENFK